MSDITEAKERTAMAKLLDCAREALCDGEAWWYLDQAWWYLDQVPDQVLAGDGGRLIEIRVPRGFPVEFLMGLELELLSDG